MGRTISQEMFTHGYCLYFAVAFQEQFGGTFMVLRQSGDLLHVWVKLDEQHYDASGLIDPEITSSLYAKLYQEATYKTSIPVSSPESITSLPALFGDFWSDTENLRLARKYLQDNMEKFPILQAA